MKTYTKKEIERYLTPAGGYLRKDFERIGVKWLPMKGWKRRLMEGKDPNRPDQLSKHQFAAKRAQFAQGETYRIRAEEREWKREAWERFE